MKYRKFGNSGVNISELGFGCMRFPELCDENNNWYIDQDKVNEMIKYAYEHGVNYFDTAPYYCHSNSEKALGTAVKDFRDKILISTKCPVTDIKEVSDFRKILNMQLERLQTDHIDFYHFWALNKDKYDNYVKKFDLINEALKCKEEGLIRHVSFSFHDKVEVIKYIIDDGKIFDSMLVQYNLLNRDHEEMIKYAHDNGLGVTVMGPVAGGKLACPGEFARKILNTSEGETYELALKFVLANENVSCALSGMQNIDQVRKNIECVSNQTGLPEEELIQMIFDNSHQNISREIVNIPSLVG
jgi:predicted aldo/keto reductase-like oxidoreductase